MSGMTRNDILELADECGATLLDGWDIDMLKLFAKRVAEREREACAKVCEVEIKRVKPIYSVTAENCVKAIRARGQG